MFVIIGLGNPGKEYENTRHNTGFLCVEALAKKFDASEFIYDKKLNSEISELKIENCKLKILAARPMTFMNKSGNAVSYFIKPKTGKNKSQENLIVVHDDLDLPIGTMKISYNKGVGGHRGLDSVVKVVKTKEFVRIRIGISPSTPKGKIKKPEGEKAVIDFILGKWKPKESEIIKKLVGKFGGTESEVVRNILIIWLKQEKYI